LGEVEHGPLVWQQALQVHQAFFALVESPDLICQAIHIVEKWTIKLRR
jgi:hypothetical protein